MIDRYYLFYVLKQIFLYLIVLSRVPLVSYKVDTQIYQKHFVCQPNIYIKLLNMADIDSESDVATEQYLY